MPFKSRVEDAPREIIVSALNRANGFVIRAAHELGIPRRTFYRRLDELKLWPSVNELRKQRRASQVKSKEMEEMVARAV